ncbi:sugar transporter SWEET1 isoform X5 [Homo sapiens]|uniref:sugar transporter SWEET1 isoform X5 n=1 Tax=Homo sapiens TaxID=9606 RepID=UPI001FB0DB23|nr:sugar transporter SWEET1 isoform X5 [Homo sapiens]XP_054193690.1 sugar transporter SWEET1 isoform X5 [Homo sapiens]
MRGLHPWHVLRRPLGPQAHANDPECGQRPVPALSHHGSQVRGRRLRNLGWLSYGALKGDGILIVVNTVGAALQTLYILAYLHYCPRKAKVIQTKSTQCLSYPLTIATLLTSASWCLYGFRLRDPYIMVSNFPGIVTSFIRFWLFWKYPQEQDRNYWLLQT